MVTRSTCLSAGEAEVRAVALSFATSSGANWHETGVRSGPRIRAGLSHATCGGSGGIASRRSGALATCGGAGLSRHGTPYSDRSFVDSDFGSRYWQGLGWHRGKMPGSSIWLLPPEDSPLNATLAALIEKTSLRFDSPHRFLPHVTLTSNISPSIYGTDPQSWLDQLTVQSIESIAVIFEKLASEDVFFRKLYIKCMKGDGIQKLATICRQSSDGCSDYTKAKQWTASEFNPHLSLL